MAFFPERTVFLAFGPFTVRWYAVCILTGVLCVYFLTKVNLKSYRYINTTDFVDDLLIYCLVFGLLVARIWYCLFSEPSYYLGDLSRIIRIWDGGIAIHGGLIGGCLAVLYLCKKRNVSPLKVFDAMVPPILLGQAIGRWGNFVNQECYGQVVDGSYYDGILSFIKNDMFIDGAYREPMFLYESVLCVIGFVLINYVLRKYQRKRGDLLYGYMMWYGVIRFFIEGRRTDSLTLGSFKMAQLISLALLIGGLVLYVLKDFFTKKPTVLFDLDGTLQDSEAAILATYSELFRRHSSVEEFTAERKVEVLGPPLEAMFAKFWPELDPKELRKEYSGIIHEKLKETLKPMPGANELLKNLKEKGYRVGVVSTRAHSSGEFCLELCGFKDYVEDYFGADDVEHTKPDPEGLFKIIAKNGFNGDDVVMVGDSRADVEAGQRYGAYTIAYISKEEKRAGIASLKPNVMIDSLDEVLGLIEGGQYFTYNER